MRKGTVWVALVASVLAAGWAQGTGGKEARAETLVRWHFAGLDQLKELRGQKPLQQVLELPESVTLRDAAIAGFSRRAAARLAKGSSTNDQHQTAANIQRLLPDFLRFETKFLMVGSGSSNADWAIAIKLPTDRAEEWRKALSDIARSAGLAVSDETNWTATHAKYSLSLSREKNWTVLRGGYSPVASASKLFADFQRSVDKGLGKQVLAAEFDFPRLGELWKAQRLMHAPRVVVNSTPNGDGFRSEAELEYSKSLGIKPERFNVPGNVIREPLVGFTAIQGVRETLQASRRFQAWGAKNPPNQLFSWSIGDSPFSAYLAGNVGNPAEVVSNLLQRVIPEATKDQPAIFLGKPQAATNRAAFVWRGLPIVVPFVEAGAGAASEFIVAGLFPVSTASTNSAPAELFEQLKKKNLIYYEWEITEGRLKQWRPIWQLVHIIASKSIVRSEAASEKWIEAIIPKLGNTITEATLDGDRRIKVVRQSHTGFNALELVLLAHWLDPNDFRDPVLGQEGKPSPPPLTP